MEHTKGKTRYWKNEMWVDKNTKSILEAADGMPTEEAVKYIEHGPEMHNMLDSLNKRFSGEISNSDILFGIENERTLKDLLTKLGAK